MWYILQHLQLKPELRRPREIFFAHAKVLEVQTLAVYGGVGVFINSTKRKPSWQALPPKGLVHQPIKHPVLLHSRSSLCNVITAVCFSQSLACVYASWSHTQHSPGTMWYAFTTCTAALVCLLPPSESVICLQCSATCCVYSPAAPPALILIRATIVFPFLHESWGPSWCTLKGNLNIYVAVYYVLYRDVFEGYIYKADCKATYLTKSGRQLF